MREERGEGEGEKKHTICEREENTREGRGRRTKSRKDRKEEEDRTHEESEENPHTELCNAEERESSNI